MGTQPRNNETLCVYGGTEMTSQDELRDRIAAALYCHRYPREPMWGALAMARGEGMDAERGQTNCVQRIYVPMAQAIIDELGLHYVGSEEYAQVGLDWIEVEKGRHIVGKWEPRE